MDYTERGSNPGRCKIFMSYPKCPDQLWGPHNLLFSGYLFSFFSSITVHYGLWLPIQSSFITSGVLWPLYANFLFQLIIMTLLRIHLLVDSVLKFMFLFELQSCQNVKSISFICRRHFSFKSALKTRFGSKTPTFNLCLLKVEKRWVGKKKTVLLDMTAMRTCILTKSFTNKKLLQNNLKSAIYFSDLFI
jgi:hypothetical protein